MAVFTGNGSQAAPSFTFSSDTDTGFYRSDSGQIDVTVNDTHRARFLSNGLIVGLPITSAAVPYANLSVYANGTNQPAGAMFRSRTSGTGGGTVLGSFVGTNMINNVVEDFVLCQGGYLGTTASSTITRIGGSARFIRFFQNPTLPTQSSIRLGNVDTSDVVTNAIFVDEDDRVGVNTTSPDFTLHVNGTARLNLTSAPGTNYLQTSGSGTTTSIVDTGISPDEDGLYELCFSGNANNGGSGFYRTVKMGYISQYTDFAGGSVTTHLDYDEILSKDGGGPALTITVAYWNSSTSTEVTTLPGGSYTGYEIRVKITGYNTSWTGAAQQVRLRQIFGNIS